MFNTRQAKIACANGSSTVFPTLTSLGPRTGGTRGCTEHGSHEGTESLRLTELFLFLTPFAAFIAWRLTARSGGPSRPVLIGAACVLAVLAAMLVWLRQERTLPPETVYVPAQLQDGRIVPGHGDPK